jgi:hypothetical protein
VPRKSLDLDQLGAKHRHRAKFGHPRTRADNKCEKDIMSTVPICHEYPEKNKRKAETTVHIWNYVARAGLCQ